MVGNETIMINIDTRYSECSIKDTLNRALQSSRQTYFSLKIQIVLRRMWHFPHFSRTFDDFEGQLFSFRLEPVFTVYELFVLKEKDQKQNQGQREHQVTRARLSAVRLDICKSYRKCMHQSKQLLKTQVHKRNSRRGGVCGRNGQKP